MEEEERENARKREYGRNKKDWKNKERKEWSTEKENLRGKQKNQGKKWWRRNDKDKRIKVYKEGETGRGEIHLKLCVIFLVSVNNNWANGAGNDHQPSNGLITFKNKFFSNKSIPLSEHVHEGSILWVFGPGSKYGTSKLFWHNVEYSLQSNSEYVRSDIHSRHMMIGVMCTLQRMETRWQYV